MKNYRPKIKDFVPPFFIFAYMFARANLFGKKNYYFTQLPRFVSPLFNSYSGPNHEDLILDYILGFKKEGFYVDIGANDPEFPGQTKRFYLKGWSGINIEPQKRPFENLKKKRTRDINLNIVISDKPGVVPFYELPDQTDVSSLNPTMAKLSSVLHRDKKIHKTEVKAITMAQLFEQYVKGHEVDFVNIDTEGHELAVLKSNNWKKYRPKLFIIEIVHFDQEEIIAYLKEKGYEMIYTNGTNGIFMEKSFKEKVKTLWGTQ